MDLVPERPLDDGFMLTGISGALMHGLANIDPVIEQLV
jgi:hypothetical protein